MKLKIYTRNVIACWLMLTIGQVICTDCPDGWLAFQGSCYLFPHNHKTTFINAENYCRQHHQSHLVQMETVAENNFIKDQMRGLTVEHHWLGLSDEMSEGTWRWYTSDTPITISDWYPGEPNDAGSVEDCAILDWDHDFRWIDVKCSFIAEPLCELSGDFELVG